MTQIDTFTAVVEIPAQWAVRERCDSLSLLETDYAESVAWLNADGTLGHRLANKARRESVRVAVPTITSVAERRVASSICSDIKAEVQKDGSISRWQRFKLDAFGWLAALLAVAVGCVTALLRRR